MEKISPFKPKWETIVNDRVVSNLIKCCVNVGKSHKTRPTAEDIVFLLENYQKSLDKDEN